MGYDVSMDPIAAEDLPADETELLEIFRSMTEQGRALVLANARMLQSMPDYKV